MTPMPPPTFSFIIPVKPEGAITALPYLEKLSYDITFEILVAEGRSPSRQRNMAAQKAQGEILYFLDDDSRITPACIEICTRHLQSPAVAVVGGPSLTPEDNSEFQKLVGYALSSMFGAGSMRNRYRSSGIARSSSDAELILCNMAMRRNVFIEMGGFDERLYPNEENELLDRIRAKGLQLIHDPSMAVYRSQRASLFNFLKQMFSYGRGRGQQSRLCGSIPLISTAPLFFILYLVVLPCISPFSDIVLVPLVLYLVLNIVFTIQAILESKKFRTVFLLCLFPLMHIINGCGLLFGFIIGVHKKPDTNSLPVSLRTIKTF